VLIGGLTSVGSRLLTICSTFILTRYLAPAVQGEVNLAFVFVWTVGAATAFGVMQYLAARPKEGRDVAFHGSVLVLGAGVVAFVGCIAGGRAVAEWLRVPGMQQYIPGMAVAHYLDRLQWVPRTVLARDLRFRAAGVRVALGEVVFASSSVALAHLGWGGNAIVGGNVLRGAVGIVFMLAVTDWRDYLSPCRLKLSTYVEILRFGVPFTVASFFYIGATNWDNSFMGYRFGEAAVGTYNQAYRLSEIPISTVSDQINDVLVPTFARIDDPEVRRRGFYRATSLMALLLLPMTAGLAVIASTMVEVFYPPSYADVGPFLAVLASLGAVRSFRNQSSALLQVAGRTGSFALIDGLLVATVLGFMALLARFGPVWSSVGVPFAFTLSLVITIRLLRPEGIALRGVFLAILRPTLACIPLVAAVLAARHGLADRGIPGVARLLVEVTCGVVSYVAAALLIAPAISRDFITLTMGVLRRRSGRTADAAAGSPPPGEG
jgi:PST family polysaccharide transporter